MFSRFFIDRPIFSIVIAVAMVLVGILTVKTLPVAQFPDITPPTVNVSASYPGADASTVASTIGVPIEEQVNGVENMMYMSSTSGSDGSYDLTITFDVGTDLDIAAVKVQNRVSAAEATLPESVKQQGIQVTTRSTNIIMFVALEADSAHRDEYDALYLTNYAKLNVVDELSRIDGVGDVGAYGAGQYSMRVWLDPEKMRVRGLTPADVTEVIESQNMQVSAGAVGAAPLAGPEAFEFTLTSKGRLTDPEEFGNIIIRSSSNGEILRLRDIARVDLGSVSYANVSAVSGHQAGLLGIYQLPGANALDVAKKVEKRLSELQEYFPEGVHYRVILNSTDFVSASIDEVLTTFVETTLIVMIVILLFLQNWRATIIPMLTIPVSLIATFAVMKLLGFSINTLTLFGLVLAIAIVVDDAIVVVEDCARLLDDGTLSPRQAAEKAMKELIGPIIGEVLVLLSVFIPTAFVSGITGELYKQFALTIAVSTAFSGFNALTFTPAMCALFLRKRKPTRFFIFRWFTKGFNATTDGYMKVITAFLKRPIVAIGVYFVICLIAVFGFMKMPTSYVPAEDLGYFMVSAQLPSGAALERTDSVMKAIQERINSIPEVTNAISITGISFMGGGNGSNTGSFFVTLKPWKERRGKGQGVDAIIDRVYELTGDIQEAVIYAINPPAIPGLGLTAGLQMQLLDINNRGAEAMKEALAEVSAAARKDPRIQEIQSLYQGTVPQFAITIDRDKARMLGLHLTDIYSTLTSYMGGGAYVNDFNTFGRVYEVLIAADANATGKVEDVMKLSVRNDSGEMVPFASFAKAQPTMGEPSVSRYNMYTSASLTAVPRHGVSSGAAIKAMEEIVNETLGNNYSYAWTGEAYQESGGGLTVSVVMIFAVIVTLLVLAAQYESLTDPVAVVISMPTAILGTVLGCLFMGQSIDIYTQIGIILLLGLSAKNAILIVEYARDYRAAGQEISQAAADAGRVRFRPIMMTALAFVFGVMPMLFATGAGAASRVSLASAVVFGMAVNAIVGTLFVPGFWELLERFREKYLIKLFAAGTAPLPQGHITTTTNTDATSDNI
ncbi:MAG: efflux RND transporter permease subunit [Pseudoflavonifractor sp.]|nr:efflux RND transporter permease subunit [Alloprevotella sp.]MCM1117234.1 efflux RND transporter permease subunit [Pseudoflavonifractor sp.]